MHAEIKLIHVGDKIVIKTDLSGWQQTLPEPVLIP